MNKEEKGSGITCDEETEVEIAVAEIIEKERAADLERKENLNALTKKDENDKASAEEVRLKAMERLGQIKKRSADSECAEVAPPKSRRNASEAVQYFKEKFAQEYEVRKKEQGSHLSQYKVMMEQQSQQQQQFQDAIKAMSEQQQRQENGVLPATTATKSATNGFTWKSTPQVLMRQGSGIFTSTVFLQGSTSPNKAVEECSRKRVSQVNHGAKSCKMKH